MEKIIIITGPTGIGKTEISLKVVEQFNGEVINCDASQIHKGLNIGTAKIDLNATSIRHHLIDIIAPTDKFSIKDFQTLAIDKIKSILSKNRVPFLIGGSGLYINSIIENYNLDAPGRDENYEKKYTDYSNEELFEKLIVLNEEKAKSIPLNNRRRLLRALENIENGYLYDRKKEEKYEYLLIVLTTSRDILYDRINKRVDEMFANGWINEVNNLRNAGINTDEIKEIGYSEIGNYLTNCTEKELCILKEKIKQKTRNYAKRQITWFNNKMPNKESVLMRYDNIQETENDVKELIKKFMNK